MRLESVTLKHFRSYTDATVKFDDLTVLVGRNDAGKSTVLEALAIFLSPDVKFDSADRNRLTMATDVEIRCIFGEIDSVTLDQSAATTLEEEYLLNSDGKLEIVKRWTVGASVQARVFLVARHPTNEGINDLLEVKLDTLKTRLEGKNLDAEDKRKAPSIRRALRNSIGEKAFAQRELPLDGEGKKLWTSIESALPLYFLFKADRSTSDEDTEAQDPMKLAVRQAMAEVQADLDKISQHVRTTVQRVASQTLEELKKIDPNLAASLSPTFKTEPKWDGLFKLNLTGDNDIPLNKRGSGVRRLVLLSFLLGEVERRRSGGSRIAAIIAIEEPETALHPRQQRLLVTTLGNLADDPSTQVVISTHSPALSALLPHRSLRMIRRDADNKAIVDTDTEAPTQIAQELGVLPDPSRNDVKVVVCVEGPTDAAFLTKASELLRQHNPDLPDLTGNDKRILVIPLGGGTLSHWVENHYLRNLKVPEVHVYDRDVDGKYQEYIEQVNARGDGSVGFLTKRRELENYYPPEGIRSVLQIDPPVFTDADDVVEKVAPLRYEHVNPGKAWAAADSTLRRNCFRRLKHQLAEGIIGTLTADNLVASGFDQEFAAWLKPVTEALTKE